MNFDELKVILVPVDFSEQTGAAIAAAVRLAQTFHASVEILHVDIDPTLVLPPPGDVIALPLMFEHTQAVTEERLGKLAEQVRAAGVVCVTASESGRTHAAIVERARAAVAGLIVMGSHGQGVLSHALLGSVAEKVVAHAPCPVLIIPGPGKR
jgi:universal stress protein A